MPSADWCVWCNRVLRGKVSYSFGLCSKCRNTKEGKDFIKKMEQDNFQEQLKLNAQRRNTMTKDKLIGTAYINIIKDEKGQVKFAYGYELNEKELSLNDLGMLTSFLGKLKTKAQQDFNERLEMNDKEFSIEKDGVEEDEQE